MGSNGVRRVTRDSFDDDDGNGDAPLDAGLVPKSRRDPLSVSLQQHVDAGLVSEVLPVREHVGSVITIRSRVTVGIDQRICIEWDVPEEDFDAGYRLLGFRRTDGFAPEEQRKQLAAHGSKIVDARTSDVKEELLAEGEYFYTFLLYRKAYLGCLALTKDLVQFSERIPSAKYAIERLEDTVRARELQRKLLRMADKDKPAKPQEDMHGMDFARLLAEQGKEIKVVKESAEWANFGPRHRRFVIDRIKKKYKRKMGIQE